MLAKIFLKIKGKPKRRSKRISGHILSYDNNNNKNDNNDIDKNNNNMFAVNIPSLSKWIIIIY